MKTAINPPAINRRPTNGAADRARMGVPREGFVTLETAVLAGAASGIAVGAIAGPPGAIVGGILGTAVGMVAGSTLDVAEKRAYAHDRELDDAIGITEGDLGAREAAVASLNAAKDEGVMVVDRELTSASELLRVEHARLEKVYDELLAAYRNGDWNDVRRSWKVFESELLEHMDKEERHVFRSFIATSPVEARQLLAEHDELRRLLETLGVNIELHAVPAALAEELVRRLREHGEHEELMFYPWIDETFGRAPLHSLGAAAG